MTGMSDPNKDNAWNSKMQRLSMNVSPKECSPFEKLLHNEKAKNRYSSDRKHRIDVSITERDKNHQFHIAPTSGTRPNLWKNEFSANLNFPFKEDLPKIPKKEDREALVSEYFSKKKSLGRGSVAS
jgi:hypothetical protein